MHKYIKFFVGKYFEHEELGFRNFVFLKIKFLMKVHFLFQICKFFHTKKSYGKC